jgi:ADP-L-glycero-D-manno-heptose 6-epimerase
MLLRLSASGIDTLGQIVITGGSGFIGSFLQAELVARGHDTVIVDWLGSEDKWRNIGTHPPSRIVSPDALEAFLAEKPRIDAVFHLGAISETTATDGDLVWSTNVALSNRLWEWCVRHSVRLIYASSAATYGNGHAGFDDDPASLAALRPLNLYGWSKHVFDLGVLSRVQRGEPAPPQWVGLKFFNVYGPNEYHKGKMISVVKVKYDEIASGKAASLFRSCEAGMPDGAQRRDFIWVGDVVDVMLWLLDHPEVNGLYNLGTGTARTYLDLAHAVCDAAEVERRVDFVEMPAALRGQYQSFTQANMSRLRAAGYTREFTSLEAGIGLYVREYLQSSSRYR